MEMYEENGPAMIVLHNFLCFFLLLKFFLRQKKSRSIHSLPIQ